MPYYTIKFSDGHIERNYYRNYSKHNHQAETQFSLDAKRHFESLPGVVATDIVQSKVLSKQNGPRGNVNTQEEI